MENQFYKLPQMLFSEKYSGISSDGKLLYCLMLDRMKLSEINGWRDDDGRIYIIFTRDEACRMLGFGKDKAARVYSELEAAGLIEQEKQYLARPTLIYVNEAARRKNGSHDDGNADILTAENTLSESGKSSVQAVGKAAAIKTYPNQNKINQIENIKTYPNQAVGNDAAEYTNSNDLKKHLDDVLEVGTLKKRYPFSAGSLEEIRDIIAEVISQRRRVTFEGKVIPAKLAAERFGMLTSENISMVLDSLSRSESDIRRVDAYIATSLYGTTFTVSSRNEVGWKLFDAQ